MKKSFIICLLIAVSIVFSSCGLFVKNDDSPKNSEDVFTTGTGQEEDPYIISTKEQLDAVRLDLDACYKLGADIDLDGFNMEPIGTDKSPFTGTMNGNGYALRYLNFANVVIPSDGFDGFGLFGHIKGAKIENLVLKDFVLPKNGKLENLGLLVGVAASDSVIENCTVNGEIDSYNYIGGLAGKLSSRSIIRNCSVDVILSGNGVTGGIVGECLDSTIEKCFVEGQIECRSSYPDRAWAGGIVGNMISGEVINSYSLATIEVTDDSSFNMYKGTAGGLIGNFKAGKMSFCYVSGEISGEHYPGGIYGNWDNGEFEQVINNTGGTGLVANGSADFIKTEGSALGENYVVIKPSGIYGYTSAQMKTPSLFSDWDTDIWDISESYYPKFKQ